MSDQNRTVCWWTRPKLHQMNLNWTRISGLYCLPFHSLFWLVFLVIYPQETPPSSERGIYYREPSGRSAILRLNMHETTPTETAGMLLTSPTPGWPSTSFLSSSYLSVSASELKAAKFIICNSYALQNKMWSRHRTKLEQGYVKCGSRSAFDCIEDVL